MCWEWFCILPANIFGNTMFLSCGIFAKMLVLLLLWWESWSCFFPHGSFYKKQTYVFCSNLRVLFTLTDHDYNHQKLWLELPAGAIHTSSLALQLADSPTNQQTNFSHPQKNYLDCCTNPERLWVTHFIILVCAKFWNIYKEYLISESYFYNFLHFRFLLQSFNGSKELYKH